jgi:hypothetical protein
LGDQKLGALHRGCGTGDKHSNHGDTVLNMIRHMVIKIKRDYRWDVPIINGQRFFRPEDFQSVRKAGTAKKVSAFGLGKTFQDTIIVFSLFFELFPAGTSQAN